ncbi:hypothetical protein FOZ63_001985 [Perkinsus olseni]|uniref:Uncharacterized protein n=1 Tax=Perkinsus olseni TaxID=32597 RepID=A0A7J6P8U9_PEROL|nr:hypothetical protein FOZ63_001985 [Perkinsus olseni]
MDPAVDDFSHLSDRLPPSRLPLVYQQRFRRIEDRLRRLTAALKEQRRSSPGSSLNGSPRNMRSTPTVELSPNDAPRERPRSIYHKGCAPSTPSPPRTTSSAPSGNYRSPPQRKKLPECHVDLSPYVMRSARPEYGQPEWTLAAPRLSVESERILADLHAMDERIANIEREVKDTLKRGTSVASAATGYDPSTDRPLKSASAGTSPSPCSTSGTPSRRVPGIKSLGVVGNSQPSESRPPSWRDLAASSTKPPASAPSSTTSLSKPSETALLAPRLNNSQPRPGQIGRIRAAV